MWRDLVLFLFDFVVFTCTVRLFFYGLLGRVEEGGGRGGCLKLDVQGQEGGKILDADEQGVWGLEN